MNARDILAASRVKVLNKLPYLDAAAFSLRLVEKPGLGTLAVDASLRLFYDPPVVEKWGVELVSGVLVHEMSHVLRDHHGRMKECDPELSNIAGDMEINDDIVRMGWKLPDGVLLPATYNMKDGELAEFYYRELKKQGKGKAQKPNGKAPGSGGKCGGCANNPGEEGMGESPDGKTDGKGGEKPGMSQADVNLVRKQTAQKISDYQATRGRGSVPAAWSQWAEKQLEVPEIPWMAVLGKQVRAALSFRAGQVDYTRRKIARSYWGQRSAVRNMPIKPGMHQPIPKVALVVDCSGSMSGKPYEKALSEITGIIKAVGAPCTSYATDAACNAKVSIFAKKDLAKLGFSGGGTDMRVGIELAEKEHPDVIVVLTDGDTPWPEIGEMPRARLIACIVGNARTPDHLKNVVRVKMEG
jgi:predicted metal-dependent peptidase